MRKKINSIQAEKIIEKSISELGLKKTKGTNPKLIREIIQEFKLDDFKTENKVMQDFFDDSSSESQDLKPMINCIKKSISLKHPAIIEFLDLAISKKMASTIGANHKIASCYVYFGSFNCRDVQ